jgi:hypothetical protein
VSQALVDDGNSTTRRKSNFFGRQSCDANRLKKWLKTAGRNQTDLMMQFVVFPSVQ